MNLDELREAMASDATKENEELKRDLLNRKLSKGQRSIKIYL